MEIFAIKANKYRAIVLEKCGVWLNGASVVANAELPPSDVSDVGKHSFLHSLPKVSNLGVDALARDEMRIVAILIIAK